MFFSCFLLYLIDDSAVSRFDVIVKIVIQSHEDVDLATGKLSKLLSDTHLNNLNRPTPISPNTKPHIQNGFAKAQDSKRYCKSENYKLFQKQDWSGEISSN